uniref:Uncharacterized protein n=1 Tax=Anguilla anguilla TaxID=7936 RepID=A0A0E9P835_ANGAN
MLWQCCAVLTVLVVTVTPSASPALAFVSLEFDVSCPLLGLPWTV